MVDDVRYIIDGLETSERLRTCCACDSRSAEDVEEALKAVDAIEQKAVKFAKNR